MRLLVVLGYSAGRRNGLHPVCAARLERAARVADADAVVLTGGARRDGALPEAELMRRAWEGSQERVICDAESRITAENAARVAALVRELDAHEVVVVTSWWHRLRAALLFRLLLRVADAQVSVIAAGGPWSLRLMLRELACLALVPGQVGRARRL